MKPTLLLITVVAVIAFPSTRAVAASEAKLLVELDSHIKWGAVDDQWKNLGAGWVAATNACSDPQCVAKQLLVLEQHVKWDAVEGDWKKRREAWGSECKSASTDAAVGKLMLELEENMGWQAVDEKWKDRRDGWVADVSSVEETAVNPVFDEKKELLPKQEWNRDINVKVKSTCDVVITSKSPKNLMLIADRSYQAMLKNDDKDIHKEDLILDTSLKEGETKTRVNLEAGHYWFIVRNDGKEKLTVQMQWIAANK
jgi:hypothetical protein